MTLWCRKGLPVTPTGQVDFETGRNWVLANVAGYSGVGVSSTVVPTDGSSADAISTSDSPTYTEALRRKALLQIQREQHRLAKEKGEWIPIDQCRSIMVGALATRSRRRDHGGRPCSRRQIVSGRYSVTAAEKRQLSDQFDLLASRISALEQTVQTLKEAQSARPVNTNVQGRKKREPKPPLHPRIIRNREIAWHQLNGCAFLAEADLTKSDFCRRYRLNLREFDRWFVYRGTQIQPGSTPDKNFWRALIEERTRLGRIAEGLDVKNLATPTT